MKAPGTIRALAAAALLLCLLSPALSAAADTDPLPAYPTATSVPQDEEGIIHLPGLSAETDRFQFAVKESAEPLINTAQVMQVAEVLEGTGLNLAVAVDREPSSVVSAAQLIRGMLLFGPIDALSDDWLEKGKTHGYVGDDWVVIGIVLPESGQGEAEVAMDLGRNVTFRDGVTGNELALAGAPEFATGDATAGVSRVIEAVVGGVQRSPNYGKYALLVLAGVAVAALSLTLAAIVRRRRRTGRAEHNERALAAAAKIHHLSGRIERTGFPPLLATNSPLAGALEWLRARGPELLDAARRAAGPQDIAAIPEGSTDRVISYAETLQQLSDVLAELASWSQPGQQVQSLRRLAQHHRHLLSTIPDLLDGRARIANAAVLRGLLVEHTDALETLESLNPADTTVLERHWQLRQELERELDLALDGSGALAAELRRDQLTDPDIYERFVALRRQVGEA